MKKLALAIAILLGMGIGAFAQNNDGGLFGYGETTYSYSNQWYGTGWDRTDNGGLWGLYLPDGHGFDTDSTAPLGSGIAVLVGLGAAYALKKRRKDC